MFKQECFSNKRFLITGASSGLGAAIALELNALGAEIIALARDSKKLEFKREKALHKERFIPVSKDISEYVSLDSGVLNISLKNMAALMELCYLLVSSR